MMKLLPAIVVGFVGFAVFASSFALAHDVPKHKFPVKLDKPNFLAGIWDVGSCYVSGQPTEDAFRKLAAEGVTTVICLRGTDEMNDRTMVTFDEAAFLKGLGINYVHIPVGTSAEYNPGAVDRFAKALGEAKGKVLLHCTVGWRASYVWASYLNKFQHESLDDAVKVGEAMNMSSDRVRMLLGADVNYSLVPKKASNAPKALKTPEGNKLKLTTPKAIFAPNDKDYMAFVLWDMGDVLNSSQPNEAHLKDLAAKGVKTIVNIRTAVEMESVKKSGFDEEAVAKSLGLEYVNIPMQSNDSFNPKNLALIHDAFTKSKGRVLLHCYTANRTSSLWPAYLVKYYGVDLNEAIKNGEAMRLSNQLTNFLGMNISYKVKPSNAKAKPCGDGE